MRLEVRPDLPDGSNEAADAAADFENPPATRPDRLEGVAEGGVAKPDGVVAPDIRFVVWRNTGHGGREFSRHAVVRTAVAQPA